MNFVWFVDSVMEREMGLLLLSLDCCSILGWFGIAGISSFHGVDL